MNSDGPAEQAKRLRDLRTTLLLFYLSSGAFPQANICCRCKRFNLSAIKLLARVGRMDVDWLPLRRANWEGLLGARSERTAQMFYDSTAEGLLVGSKLHRPAMYRKRLISVSAHAVDCVGLYCISQQAECYSHKPPAKFTDTHCQLDTSVSIAN